MNITKQINTIISRARPVRVTFKNGDAGTFTIINADRRLFRTKEGNTFHKSDVLRIDPADDQPA